MSLDTVVASLIKKSLNKLINKNSNRQRFLARLQGKTLSLHFTDINKKLIFVFGQDIEVLTDHATELDCSLSMALSILPQLKDKSQLASLIKQNKLQLEGDIEVLSQFASLLEEIDFDIAEWLSDYTGDIFAQTVVTGAKSVFSQIKTLSVRQQRYVSETLVEEWKFVPSILEIAHFVDSVEDVQNKMIEFEAKLNAFEMTLDSKISQ